MNGNILISYRRENGLTQRYIAYKMGVSQQAVVKWESGKSVPRGATLLKLAKLLGVSADELLEKPVNEAK